MSVLYWVLRTQVGDRKQLMYNVHSLVDQCINCRIIGVTWHHASMVIEAVTHWLVDGGAQLWVKKVYTG